MKQQFSILLHLFYPAGIECVRIDQNQSVSNVQPNYSAGDVPAKENDQMMKKLVLTVLIVLATLTLGACAPRVTSTSLSPEEGATYAAEVDDVVESYFAGTNECDFDMAHRGFGPDWDIDESAWQQECEADLGVYGAYQSKTLDHVEVQQGYRVVIYRVVFENDPDVTLRVFFRANDPDHLIVGMDWEGL